MSNSNWYSEDNWYAPVKTTHSGKKKGWTRARVIGAIILALAMLVGSSVIFAQGRDNTDMTATPGVGDTLPADNEQLPENWKDFFENYYEGVESGVADVDIPRYAGNAAYTAAVAPQGDSELTMQELYAKCAPSIVAISGYKDKSIGYSWGSGIVVSTDGYIITNTHVIDDCDRAVITLEDGTEYEAELVGADGISDVALLKIDAQGLKAAELGDSNSISAGDKVVAIGNPLGEAFRLTMTDGIISAIDRGMNYLGHSMTLMQTNAALNEGNSGGALFNMYGQVIGVTNMKMMSAYSSIEGIGFAIPSATACEIVNELMANGEVRGRPSIGITVGEIPSDISDYYEELPQTGLYVSDVSKNSDAYVKGIMEGDIVIAVNGVEVATTEDVSALKQGLGVGDTMTFTIWRNGEVFDVEVTLMDTNDVFAG